MTNSAFTIRQATVSDAGQLAKLSAQTFTETFGAQNTPENLKAHNEANYHPDVIRAELADPDNTFYVVEAEGEMIGYTKINHNAPPECVGGDNPMQVARIYVVRAWQGYKIGALLMRTCLEEARKRDCDSVWLGVWEINDPAIGFYKKWGFTPVGTQIYVVGDDPQTDVVMQCTL